jgi:hypothetical protein
MDGKMTPKQEMYGKSGAAVIKALAERHFEAYFAPDKESALRQVLQLIPANHVVSWGGSLTLTELGVIEAVKKAGNRVIDRDSGTTSEERNELSRQGLLSDTWT